MSKTGPNKPTDDPRIQQLFDLTRKKPLPFADLCDRMDLSPSKARLLIARARDSGLRVRVAHDHVGLELSSVEQRIQNVAISPTVGKRQTVAVISDIHLGSKYCLREQMQDFILHAYDRGAREVLIPGDVLDGDYHHSKFEMSHMGIEDQTRDLFDTLPRKRGLTYHMITGNHDFTFTEKSGVDVGQYVMGYFRQHGRDDLTSYGDRSAYLELRGAVIHLWHPSGGRAYARSYKLQKKIEGYPPGLKPHIVLAGHWHMYCHVFERGVHALACPTFQGGQSAYGNSFTESPAIGGILLDWELTKEGTMRNFRPEYRAYYEAEHIARIVDPDWEEIAEPPQRGSWAKRFRALRGDS